MFPSTHLALLESPVAEVSRIRLLRSGGRNRRLYSLENFAMVYAIAIQKRNRRTAAYHTEYAIWRELL
jgi:hypothetical protein